MAFDYDEVNPTNDSYIADFPANERAQRLAVLSSVDVEHSAEGSGFHRQVTLPPLGGNPLLSGAAGFFYTKDVAGITEAFYQDEGGQVIQLTSNGSASPDKVAKAGDTMTGDLLIDTADLEVKDGEVRLRNTYLRGRDIGNANWRKLAGVNGSDVAEFGDIALGGGLRLYSDGVDEARVSYGSGDKKLWHAGHFATLPRFFNQYTSADIAFTTGGSGSAGSVPHGIGSRPPLWAAVLKCVISDLGFVPDDVVPILGGTAAATALSFTVAQLGDTAFGWRAPNNKARLIDNGGGGSSPITDASWRIVFYAWY